ncbi:serine/threonine protein kinase [Amycolatopsis vastitatis]|uniref:non-specific serine/threonine protein kinase n=1 Tax=Amycolatopsis vastitatis TaxID=1905142 RepID=A0A229SMS6_9PSEU|nr:serine/threonine protein kinase [Amycolatopsis vastitatis]
MLAGRYEVGNLIGSGATARVYRAFDVRLAREVAVKIYDRDAVALDQRRRLREMTIQGSISHPGVVALLDSGTESGRTYLVMQLVEGENVAERLLGGPMPVAEVAALAEGLAEALAHVHERRVVHRDLKPANVFLSADGPLIGDFGIAHALDATHITGTGLIPGTAAYLAPEQVSGEPAGPPADVYALGLILLECLTGEREYPGTMVEAAMARLTRPPRIPDDLPPSLAHALRRMTQRVPADRPTAAEVVGLLQAPPDASERRPVWRRQAAAGIELPRDPAAGAPANPSPVPRGGLAADRAHDHDPATKTFAVPGPAAGAPAAGNPARRRLAAAAGLTAAAVAVVSAMLLVEQENGTGTPAQQPPAANSPAATVTPPSSTSPAGSGNPAPRTGTGNIVPPPPGSTSASPEPAAVTHETPSSSAEQTSKTGKPEKTEPPGKGKGKGHDS